MKMVGVISNQATSTYSESIKIRYIISYLFLGKFVGIYPIPAKTPDPINIETRKVHNTSNVQPLILQFDYKEMVKVVNNGTRELLFQMKGSFKIQPQEVKIQEIFFIAFSKRKLHEQNDGGIYIVLKFIFQHIIRVSKTEVFEH